MQFWPTPRITTKVHMTSLVNPPHPGLTLRDDSLSALNLQLGDAASQLGVDRTTLCKVRNEMRPSALR